MTKLKIMSVFGTRPEAIKMAPLVRALEQCPEIESICCVSAQHREMLDSVMDTFSLHADRDLDIMTQQQTLSGITSRCLVGMEQVIAQLQPDMVLVHGDTSTTFSGALAAFYNKTAVGHVEAGLRSFSRYSPFPEEMNRKMVSAMATLHFCPTVANRENLLREGISDGVFVTGNTVIDALRMTVREDFTFRTDILNTIDYQNRKVILLTCHRRENYGEPMQAIMQAMRTIVEENPDAELIYPVHLSPTVQETARRYLDGVARVHLIEPLATDEMHNLMARCYLVMTDSGGLQEEAPSLGKPVLVLRRETERPEAVEAGTVRVAGVAYADIVREGNVLLRSREKYEAMARAVNPYGDGAACRRIVQAILWHYGRCAERPADYVV